jgi:hypothetical protein
MQLLTISSFKFSVYMYAKPFIKITISLTLYSGILIALSISATDHLTRAAVGIPARR